MTECEDCGEDCGRGTDSPRRYRCGKCGLLVCGWCMHHVHALERDKDRARLDSRADPAATPPPESAPAPQSPSQQQSSQQV